MKILIVDDNYETLQHLAAIVVSAGHHVAEAGDGKTALEIYQKFSPDLVLMDVILPDISGVEVAVQIKSLAEARFVPIIFVTSISEMEVIAGFVQSGGDGFLIKPVEPVVLLTKIQALGRISGMYKKLDEYKRHIDEEMQASKYLLNDFLSLDLDLNKIEKVQSWATSPGYFSGDLRLIKKLDNGEILILLCDFTGHGLPAAIGTIFVADLFRSMTKKQFDASLILNEINEKMHQILPTGRYCAASMISYKPNVNNIRIWNCGLPSVLLLNSENRIKQKVNSAHVPLGVLAGPLDYEPMQINAKEFNAIVVFSDGITEAKAPDEQMYGENRLFEKIENVSATDSVFQIVKADVTQFMNGEEPTDDISLIVLDL